MSLSGLSCRTTQDQLIPTMMRWHGKWNKEMWYNRNECVIGDDNIVYICLQSTNKNPLTEPNDWQPMGNSTTSFEARIESLEKENRNLQTELTLLKQALADALDALAQK